LEDKVHKELKVQQELKVSKVPQVLKELKD
jgi:hypothetical protein